MRQLARRRARQSPFGWLPKSQCAFEKDPPAPYPTHLEWFDMAVYQAVLGVASHESWCPHRQFVSQSWAYVIDISGNGFLYNMVRIIAGTITEIGRGRMQLSAIQAALESGDRQLAGPTLPPEGVRLRWIRYSDEKSLEPM